MGSIGDPLKILLVEDNSGHAELVIRNLRRHRVANEIVHVPDGEQALNYLFQREKYAELGEDDTPHLILLDLRLPRIDGLEVLKQIKNNDRLKVLPVVVLTSSEAEADMARAYEYNVNSYIVKPVDFAKFSQMMEDLGFYWLAWNRIP